MKNKLLKFVWLLVWLPLAARAETVMFLNPANGNYEAGEIFPINIEINSDDYVNAAQAVLKLPSSLVSLSSFSKINSIFTLWPDNPVLKGERISWSAGLPQPGFSGHNGRALTIYLRADSPGTARVNFVSASVHANDGRGTNILNSLVGGTYTILPAAVSPDAARQGLPPAPVISSPTHIEQNHWYQADIAVLLWKLPAGTQGMSQLFDDNPDGQPAPALTPATTSAIFIGLDNGIWYFHLRFKNEVGWGQMATYQVRVDQLPPEPFAVRVDKTDGVSLSPVIYFPAVDLHSGVDFYEIEIDDTQASTTDQSQYRLEKIGAGMHRVKVTAYDKAGNQRSALADVEIVSLPVQLKIAVVDFSLSHLIFVYYLLIFLLLLLLLLLLFLWRRRRDDKEEKQSMDKELSELNESVDFGFTTLRRDLLSEIDLLNERESRYGLTETEQERLKKLKVDLDVVEGYVRKELDDIISGRGYKKKNKNHFTTRR